MSSIYFKRWTRMHFFPALKHFHKWDVLDDKFDIFKPIITTNEYEEGLVSWKPKYKGKTYSLDKKLLDKLFLKYPDLKYEKLQLENSIDKDKDNMFSYAYKFIRKQKILMNQGIQQKKAFEIVEKQYQSKMARKFDQTLLARGLAIGNRARSLMTTYQQQMQYQSRLKAVRTHREVQKYQKKIDNIKQKVEKQAEDEYKRVLHTIKPNQMKDTFQDFFGLEKPQEQQENNIRMAYITAFSDRVSNMFKTYYSRAASKDKLEGLTDQQIQNQIMASPTKIRKQLQQILKIAKKHNVTLNQKGQLNVSDVKNPKIKEMLTNNPHVKVALMLQEIDYEQPHRMQLRRELRERKNALENKEEKLTDQQKQLILKNKKIVYSELQPYDLRESFQTYKAFQTYEQRLLRIQIKWLQSKITQLYNQSVSSTQTLNDSTDKLKELVDRFRRLKFRIDQKIKYITDAQIQEMFEEHKLLQDSVDIGKNVEFQGLFHYLRIKQEQRRMTPADAANDDKIHSMISNIEIQEDPKPEGWKRLHQ